MDGLLSRLIIAASHLDDLTPRAIHSSTGDGLTRYCVQFIYHPSDSYHKYFHTRWTEDLEDLVDTMVQVLESEVMANIFKMSGDLFTHLAGEMIPIGKELNLTITKVIVDELEGRPQTGQRQPAVKERAVILFKETDKGLILGNKTNVKTMVHLLGEETDEWQGKRITLYSTIIKAFGEEYQVIRIKPELPPANGVKREQGQG